MVRTRVVQTLYAGMDKKFLLKQFSDTYVLYQLLLQIPDALVRYAIERDEEGQKRAKAMHTEYLPHKNLRNSMLVAALDHCNPLRNTVDKLKLNWDGGHAAIEALYDTLMTDPHYEAYHDMAQPTWEDDKALWRHIYNHILPTMEVLYESIEDLELKYDGTNWSGDLDIVLSYALKTIKGIKEGVEPVLLEMFDDEKELKFATDLLLHAWDDIEENERMISAHLQGWNMERIAKMDHIILSTAISEIRHFDDIALQISMNEYIELSKEYSSEKSYLFVNGVLTQIAKELNIIHKQPC